LSLGYPSPNMPLTLHTPGVIAVDDSNNVVTYRGTWKTSGVPEEYDGTTHGTYLAGSTAAITFIGD